MHKIHYFKVYNAVGFSIFMKLCNHHHYPIPEHFITPKRNLICNGSRSTFPPAPPPGQPVI